MPGSHPLRAQPGIDVFSDLILGDAVSLLDYSLELIATTGNAVQIIVSEIAPFFLHAAFQLFPVSFNAIPVHEYLVCHLTRQDMTRGYTPEPFRTALVPLPLLQNDNRSPLPLIFSSEPKAESALQAGTRYGYDVVPVASGGFR